MGGVSTRGSKGEQVTRKRSRRCVGAGGGAGGVGGLGGDWAASVGREIHGKFSRPESLGIVVGTVHMICVIIFQVYYYTVADAASVWKVKLEEYNAALAATIFMM